MENLPAPERTQHSRMSTFLAGREKASASRGTLGAQTCAACSSSAVAARSLKRIELLWIPCVLGVLALGIFTLVDGVLVTYPAQEPLWLLLTLCGFCGACVCLNPRIMEKLKENLHKSVMTSMMCVGYQKFENDEMPSIGYNCSACGHHGTVQVKRYVS